YDEEFGEPVLAKVYRGLKEDDRLEVIDRVRRGEDVADLLEEVSMREADVEALQEMTAKRGPDPQVVERIREMIAQQQPDLLTGFDEVVAAMPARRPRAARGSLNLREGEHPGDRSMAELMQMSKAELSSAAARSGVPARPNWSKERIAGELRAAAARRLTPEPTRELKMGEMPDKPAVPVKFSITPAAIVSLIDGSKHTDIRPHLKQRGVTLEQYARQFDLPPDYPVLAPNEVDRRYDAVRTTVSDDEFAKQFTIGAELAPSDSAGETEASPQPEAPQRDTAAEFLRLLAGKTPRAQWASSLGVTEKELKPHIDRALAKGLLRRDRNGVIRRNPAALKEFEP
ncbi:MAG TPA: MucR family transcriptional regulator, partial [Burkholderiales bacterium]|nr:MucR family transcriptional regulator [Burkholderiales bacterium]